MVIFPAPLLPKVGTGGWRAPPQVRIAGADLPVNPGGSNKHYPQSPHSHFQSLGEPGLRPSQVFRDRREGCTPRLRV